MIGFIGKTGPWEMIIMMILVVLIAVAIIARIAKGGNAGKVILGIILIILAIGANVVASGLWNEGQETWLIHSTTEGKQMMVMADGIKYCGIALGILGLVFVSIPLLSSKNINNSVSNSLPRQNTMNICSSCGANNLPNAKFCSQCSTSLISNNQIPSSNQSYCPNCGKNITKSAAYCHECGGKTGFTI